MFTKKICKTLLTGFAIAFFAQASYAELTLKLGTTGRLGMPIGDAIDQALMPELEKASAGKMKIEPFILICYVDTSYTLHNITRHQKQL